MNYCVYLAVPDRVKTSGLDAARKVVHLQMSQHHHTTEKQCSRVGLVLAGNVWSCAVDLTKRTFTSSSSSSSNTKVGKRRATRHICFDAYSFEDGRIVLANVATGREAETADETGAQIAKNVAVQVRHDEHVELARILHHLQAHRVQVGLLKLNVRILLGHLSHTVQEETIRQTPIVYCWLVVVA